MHIDEVRLKELLRKMKDNNMSYFDEFYNTTKVLIYSNIYSYVKNQATSEDLLQETYIKFLSNLNDISEEKSIIGFLLTISKNISLDYIKKFSRVNYGDDYEYVSEDSSLIDKDLILKKIRDILNKKEVDIFILHVLGDLGFNEIAEILNKPLGTVLWSYNNSIKKLRKELKL
ncbi:MAG: sigma-70 family RNA polymerase sigma factor [Mollicutes bacterium]|nr:sigma-70 family RNA polymerase sigma factor [Mollicutes bacterium]MDD7264336.1 sigma-70 family RNA polymerase sigma factor [bacterium]MDY4979044.1 sigma-70 family RNA polymerase sigma factor [Candidatus Onthovivens sp.]